MKPEFYVRILGKSSAVPSRNSFLSSQLLSFNRNAYLIDCGEGSQMQLIKNNESLLKIRHIFISHLHGDHYYGLFGLLSSMNLSGRKQILHIYSHPKLERIIKFVFIQHGSNKGFQIVFHKLDFASKNLILETKDLEIYSFPLKHKIPVCGFLFSEKINKYNIDPEAIKKHELNHLEIRRIKEGADLIRNNKKIALNSELTLKPHAARSYAYCSDTAYFDDLSNLIKNTSCIYHEATFSEENASDAEERYHSTGSQAALTAKNASAKKLLLGHFSNRYKNPDIIVKEAREVFPEAYPVNENDKIIID